MTSVPGPGFTPPALAPLPAAGSRDIVDNDVTLIASKLPISTFGNVIVGRMRGFVPNPGGRAGNLCLGGGIGRFGRAGQTQQSDATGMFALPIDLAMIPQASGFFVVQPNETWRFQAWHRGVSPTGPTSRLRGPRPGHVCGHPARP